MKTLNNETLKTINGGVIEGGCVVIITFPTKPSFPKLPGTSGPCFPFPQPETSVM